MRGSDVMVQGFSVLICSRDEVSVGDFVSPTRPLVLLLSLCPCTTLISGCRPTIYVLDLPGINLHCSVINAPLLGKN